MTTVTYEIHEEWKPLYDAAIDLVTQVMTAGSLQRAKEGKPLDEWMRCDPVARMKHAFMHAVVAQTHQAKTGNPWSLTDNTYLYDYMHEAMGLIIVHHRLQQDDVTEFKESVEE